MNVQFETAYAILRDFYGEPQWLENPKAGQSTDAIIEKWCEELKGYSIDQIRQACAWLTRKRRVMSFPSLDVLLCELSDKEKTEDSSNESQRVLREMINHQPPLDEIVIQRTMWRLYGIKYLDYDPEKDKG